MNTSGGQAGRNAERWLRLDTGGGPAVRQQFVELLDGIPGDSGEGER